MSEWKAVAALAFAAIAVFADTYITQPLLPLLGIDYGVSASVAGFTISAVVFSIALVSLAYGPVADRFGRKKTMVYGLGMLAFATLACAFAPNFAWLVALRAVQGLCIPAITAVAVVYLGDLRAGGDPGSFVGVYIGATVLGGLTGRVASGLIAEATTWRVPFVVFAAVTLLAALGLALSLREEPVRARRPPLAESLREMRAHFADSRLVGAYIVAATLFFGFIGLFTYLPYLLSAKPYQLSTGAIAWFFAAYAAGVVTAPIAGRLSSRLPRRALLTIGFAIAIAGTLLTALPGLVAIAFGLVVLCVGMFTAQAVAPAYVNVTAASGKASANALYQTFYYVGAIFGSTVPGVALEHFGWPGVVGTCAASLAIGTIACITLCSDGRSRPPVPLQPARIPGGLR